MFHFKSASSFFAACSAVFVAGSLSASTINIPNIAGEPPQIDGKMSANEWDCASASLVCLSNTGDFSSPYGQFYIARKNNDLYLAFVTDSMDRMPVAAAVGRDGNVWEDDAFEIFLKSGNDIYQMIINSAGTIYDRKNSIADWNAPWKAATSLIGSDFAVGYAGGEKPRRGFIVEAMLPMDKAGMVIPKDGDQWNLQVVLDQVKVNPQTSWHPIGEVSIGNSTMGRAIWGGAPNLLQNVNIQEDGRLISFTGDFADSSILTVTNTASKSVLSNLKLSGSINNPISLPGGATYMFNIRNDKYYDLAFPITAKLRVTIAAVPVPSRESFFITCDPARLGKGKRYPVEMSILRGDKTLWNGSIDTAKLKQRKSIYVSYKGWGAGPVQLVLKEVKPSGEKVDIGKIDLNVPSGKPEWSDYKMPEVPAVPAPWTPVKATQKSAIVWGRKYIFGNSPFLDQVNSVGADILASPVTLTGSVNGKQLVWKMDSWKLLSSDKDKAIYAGVASASGINIRVKTTIEFDGLTRFDWRFEPGKRCEIRDLAFVVPVKRSIAKSFMQWPLQRYSFNDQTSWNKSGDVTDAGFHCEFTPFFWLGDQTRGIQWFAEHRAGWRPADNNRIIEVKRNKKSVDLILHLADGKQIFDKPLDFTFGLIASPVKPRYSACDMCGNRIMAYCGIEQMTAKLPARWPIEIPRSRADVTQSGCTEIDLRLDKDKTSQLACYGNSLGNSVTVQWHAEKRALQAHHRVADTGEQVLICEAKVDLKPGEWHRIAWNYGSQTEIYLDGAKVASGTDNVRMPDVDFWSQDQLAGSGNISLKGWRISRSPRTEAELESNSPLVADATTTHLELLQYDPTPMNMTNPVVGLPASPAYINGDWKYDAKDHILTAGADNPDITYAEHMGKIGMHGVVLFVWSKNILGNDGPTDPEMFKESIDLCNKYGIRVLLYTLWGVTNFSPDYEDCKWELSLREPEEENPVGWRERGQITYGTGVAGGAEKRNLYQIEQMLKMGAGGVYLDGVVAPDDSTNPIQGYKPVIDPFTGKRVLVSHIFDRRKYLQEMYNLVKHYRPDGIVDAHASAGFDLPVMSFVTDATNGESLGVIPKWQAAVDPSVIRSEFQSRQFGFNSESLMYNNFPVPVEYGMALMGVHGENPRGMWGMWPARAEGLWKLVDKFDTNTAQWMPYYYPEKNAFKPKSPSTLASAFVHPGKRTLLLIANWTDQPKKETIRVDWQKLGLSENTPVRICNWNQPAEVKNGSIELSFKQRQILYVWIGK